MKLLCLFAALAVSSATANIILPASQWGSGDTSVLLNVAYPQGTLPTGSGVCNTGFGSPLPATGCNITQSSSLGSSTSTTSSFNDANGIHVYAEVSSSGWESSTAEAFSAFTDTITNNSGVVANFQIGYSFDGSMTVTGGGDAFIMPEFWNAAGAVSYFQDHVLGLQWQQYQDNGTPATQTFNQTFLSPVIALNPGQSYVYTLSLDAYSITSQTSGTADAIANFSDTLALSSFTATDQLGNALSASQFGSADGINYAGTTSAPEPATFGLIVIAGASLFAWTRKR